MDYRIVVMPSGSNWVVYDVNDKAYGNYDAEHKAKRRIRDLKAKELTAGVHGNLIKPDVNHLGETPEEAAEASEAYANAAYREIDAKRASAKIGCYPAVSKHSYRR